LSMSGGANQEARFGLEDASLAPESWQEHLASLLRSANDAKGSAQGRLLLRAARIARRFAPDEAEPLLARAYAADPESRQIAALYEGLLAEQGRFDALEAKQRDVLAATSDRGARAMVAMAFGTRWVAR